MRGLTDRETYYRTISGWQTVPYVQQQGWLDASGENKRELLFFLDGRMASAGHLKRFCGVRWLQLGSPALCDGTVTVAERRQFYEYVLSQGFDIVEINDNSEYDAETEVALREAGFLRPVGSFSYQLTNIIDLTQQLTFNENWRRNLKKADSAGLRIVEKPSPTAEDTKTLWSLYQEMSSNKHLQMPFSERYFPTLLKDPHFRLYFVEDESGECLAAMTVHACGTHAGLLYAANSTRGNKVCSGAWMYRAVMEDLRDKGFASFDMEKMGASVHSTQSVFQFKQGVRGRLTSLNGEWQWCRRSWMPVAMYMLKKYKWKRVQA